MISHIYDETAGHPVVVAAMSMRRPLWRPALIGLYVELVAVAGKRAVAAARGGRPDRHVDRVVTLGDIVAIEPHWTDCVVAAMVHYGLAVHIGGERFQLVQHDKLTHSKTAMQLWWEAEAKKNTQDPALKAAVRWRDGDQCRVCHGITKWAPSTTKTDPLGGTLDHRTPGELAESPDDLAVVCRRCNGIRSDNPEADAWAPWQPVPAKPYYTKGTSLYLRDQGYKVDPAGSPLRVEGTGMSHKLDPITILARPTIPVDTALSDLYVVEVPLPQQWAWEAHQDGICRLCGSRPHHQWDTAPEGLHGAHSAQASPPSDPAPSGITLPVEPPENATRTRRVLKAFSPPETSHPRSNETLPGGGLESGEGMGGVGMGSGGGGPGARRRRGRRAKPRSQANASPASHPEEKS